MVIDARGHACPQPVLMTQNALKDNDKIEVLVDNETAKENIFRFATGKGYTINIDEEPNDEYRLNIKK